MFLYSLGFGLAISWLWLFYLQGPLLAPAARLWGISPAILLRWFMGSLCLTYLLLAQGVKIRSLRNKKLTLISCSIILSLTPLLTSLWPLIAAKYTSPALAVALAAVSGLAAAVFYTAWSETISFPDLRQSSLMTGLAFFFAGVIAILGLTVGYKWLLPLPVLFPPLSLFLLLHQGPDTPALLNEYPQIDSVKLFPAKLIIPLCLIYLNGGIMIHIVSLEQSYTDLFYLSYLAYAIFCPLAGLILHNNEHIDLRFIYRLVLPMMLAGFLLFCFQGNFLGTAAFVLLQGASALLNLYIWLLFPYFARFSTRPAAVCAFGQFVSTFSVLIGNIIAGLLAARFFGDHDVKDPALTACLVAAVIIFLFPANKETFSGWQALFTPGPAPGREPEKQPTTPAAPKPSLIESPAAAPVSLANLPLSAREKEVLALLLKGRSGRFISELLNISSNTVKFHTRNIYSKLSVNNRQELLTMFENE